MEKTTCDWTVERLPWWANGTLDETEARSVAEHLEGCAACRAELASTRQAFALYGAHPPIESLLDFVESVEAGEGAAAGAPSRAVIEGHLAHCAACREEVAMLRESRAAVEAEQAASGATVRAFLPSRREESHRRRGVDRRGLALAASLVLFAIAAGGWFVSGQRAERHGEQVAELERQLAEATEAIVEPPPEAPVDLAVPAPAAEPAPAEEQAALIAELESEVDRLEAELASQRPEVLAGGLMFTWRAGEVLRSGEPVPERVIEIAAGEPVASFFIAGLREGSYRLTIEDADGRIVVARDGLRPRTTDDLEDYVWAAIPLAQLPPGDLRLRLSTGGEVVESAVLRRSR